MTTHPRHADQENPSTWLGRPWQDRTVDALEYAGRHRESAAAPSIEGWRHGDAVLALGCVLVNLRGSWYCADPVHEGPIHVDYVNVGDPILIARDGQPMPVGDADRLTRLFAVRP